jgi:hypothetical protein
MSEINHHQESFFFVLSKLISEFELLGLEYSRTESVEICKSSF